MNYALIRNKIEDGDVVLVKSRGIAGTLVRILTGESFNHVGMFLVMQGGVWVAEMSVTGFKLSPASQWVDLNSKRSLFYGKAPLAISGNDLIEPTALQYRGRGYSFWTLVTTWVAQVFKANMPAGAVCSTFIQQVWEKAGYKGFTHTADPGDIFEHCTSITALGDD